MNWYKIAQLEITDSQNMRGQEMGRFYTDIGHDINLKEPNRLLGKENKNYNPEEPNYLWIYNDGKVEVRPETLSDNFHGSPGLWGSGVDIDKLYTGRYSPSEKTISILPPHEGISSFREIPQFLQQSLQRKFTEAEKIIRY